jgi:hypothetical protein
MVLGEVVIQSAASRLVPFRLLTCNEHPMAMSLA